MAHLNFISLEQSLYKAMNYRNSPDTFVFYFGGVHLVPGSPYPYIQTTKNEIGINLEDWEAYVYSMCGEELADITGNFDVIDNFQDPDTGLPQITWKLTDLPDVGYQLVYLRIVQLNGDEFFSTPFILSSEGIDRTCRIDYRNDISELMQSTQVGMYFRDFDQQVELKQYYEISTKQTVNTVIKNQSFEYWLTRVIDKYLILKILESFYFRFTYVDLVRASLFEAVEIPRLEGGENFSETEVKISFNKNDTYDPNYMPPIPIPPDPNAPRITLNSILFRGEFKVFYYFELANLTPQYLRYEYSVDGVSWSGITTTYVGINTKLVNTFLPGFTYFRIKNEGSGTISNVIHQLGPQNVITSTDSLRVSPTQFQVLINYRTDAFPGVSTISLNMNGIVYSGIPNNGAIGQNITSGGGNVTLFLFSGITTSETITITLEEI